MPGQCSTGRRRDHLEGEVIALFPLRIRRGCDYGSGNDSCHPRRLLATRHLRHGCECRVGRSVNPEPKTALNRRHQSASGGLVRQGLKGSAIPALLATNRNSPEGAVRDFSGFPLNKLFLCLLGVLAVANFGLR